MARIPLSRVLTETPPEPEWLVPGLLCKGTMIVLAGGAGVGKSVLCYTLAMALASGRPFLGRALAPTRVLYIDQENSLPDLTEYLHWVWRGLGEPSVAEIDTRLRIEHFSLSAAGAGRYNRMRGMAAEHNPELIVLDTTAPVCQLEDENDNAEASRAIRELRTVQSAAGNACTILLLKHAKLVTQERADDEAPVRHTIRGAKTWSGELDGTLFHVARPGRPRKDGLRPTQLEPDKIRAFGLQETLEITASWTREVRPRGIRLGVGK